MVKGMLVRVKVPGHVDLKRSVIFHAVSLPMSSVR